MVSLLLPFSLPQSPSYPFYLSSEKLHPSHASPSPHLIVLPPDDFIVAISSEFNVPAHCGQRVRITNTGGGGDANHGQGQTAEATVVDTCPSCGRDKLDLSEGLFRFLTGGSTDSGIIDIDW